MELRQRNAFKPDQSIRPSLYNAIVGTVLFGVFAYSWYFLYQEGDAPKLILVPTFIASAILGLFVFSFWRGLLRPNNYLMAFQSDSVLLPLTRPINKTVKGKDWVLRLSKRDVKDIGFIESEVEKRSKKNQSGATYSDRALNESFDSRRKPYLVFVLKEEVDQNILDAIKDLRKQDGFSGTQFHVEEKSKILFKLEGQSSKRKALEREILKRMPRS